jgi:hypothetical protein
MTGLLLGWFESNAGDPFFDNVSFPKEALPLGICAFLLGFDWVVAFWLFAYNRFPNLAERCATPVYMVCGLVVNIFWFQALADIERQIPSDEEVCHEKPAWCGGDDGSKDQFQKLPKVLLSMAAISFVATSYIIFHSIRTRSAYYEPVTVAAEENQGANAVEASAILPEGQCAKAYRLRVQRPAIPEVVVAQAPRVRTNTCCRLEANPWLIILEQASGSRSPNPHPPAATTASFHPVVKFWHANMYPYNTPTQPFLLHSYMMFILCAGHLAFQIARYYHRDDPSGSCDA